MGRYGRGRSRYDYDYYPRYSAARPLEAKDGIQAKSRTGKIGETWWAQRFIQALERFTQSNRLTRGRSYARSGQVKISRPGRTGSRNPGPGNHHAPG